ncbi:MAG: ABC transporter transmembrane domain-containing protein [Waltera sp.]
MDATERKMTKIAREVSKFTVQTMKEDGIGTAEFDFIHLVRHNPGITQAAVREQLKIDKGAAARRAASLESKGYLYRKPNPADGRSQLLYATEKAEQLKNSKAAIESKFYEWLLAELPEEEKEAFCKTLDTLYWRTKQERRAGFVNVAKCVEEGAGEDETDTGDSEKDQILYYFKTQWTVLLAVTISGLIYNLGLLAGPWFEGRMTGCLVDILGGKAGYRDMLVLVTTYVISIAIVQISRYIKRFYVRRFANNVNRDMKEILYRSLVHRSRAELEEEGVGNVMTKAILDVDDCAEGMRKFTTEIFDTGVALAAYVGMLLFYDWRLAILGMLFLPVSYVLAEKMKRNVQRTGAAYKEQSGDLSAATLDRAANAVTYRVYGREKEREQAYEANLTAYEKSAVKANIWSTAFPPLYRIISMTGILFILYFGSRNVLGTGWKIWDVAAFTTFLSCFLKLAVKSSHAAKLFNAVHKAQVSWKRIKLLMKEDTYEDDSLVQEPGTLEVSDVSFAYPGGEKIYEDFNLSATPGQIIGVTGAVACGKSTLGKTFLCEYPYEGRICFHGKELSGMTKAEQNGMVGYLGHDPELFNDSVRNNILLGDDDDPEKYLKAVCFDGEVAEMEEGMDTIVGNGGVRLSGGQAQRLALARTLCHKRPVLILDDPFSALDRKTEEEVFANLRKLAADSIVILLSHRLYLFPEMDQVLWMEDGKVTAGTHEQILEKFPEYARLYEAQADGAEAHSTQEGGPDHAEK